MQPQKIMKNLIHLSLKPHLEQTSKRAQKRLKATVHSSSWLSIRLLSTILSIVHISPWMSPYLGSNQITSSIQIGGLSFNFEKFLVFTLRQVKLMFLLISHVLRYVTYLHSLDQVLLTLRGLRWLGCRDFINPGICLPDFRVKCWCVLFFITSVRFSKWTRSQKD